MLDTAHIVLDLRERPFPEAARVGLLDGLECVEERTRRDTGERTFSGRMGALQVRLTPSRLIVRGSLTNHSHYNFPTRAQLVETVERIETRLGVPLRCAMIWRLDVFADLDLQHPPAHYLPLLLAKPRFQRVGYEGTSVAFQCDQRTIRFYDKWARLEKGRLPTDGPLRIEVALLNRLGRQVGHQVLVEHLSCPRLWERLVDLWLREYESIEKANELVIPLGCTAKTRRDFFLAAGVHNYGGTGILGMLEVDYRMGTISKRQYQRERRYYLGLLQDERFTVVPESRAEMDAAVARATATMRDAGQ